MTTIPNTILQNYRSHTFRLKPPMRLKTPEGAIQFVKERGFIYFWPIKGVLLPSLWVAVAGDRPVASEHDDPGHVTWGWKDQLLDQREWYYAKILRGKATLISLDTAPYFYALSDNYGNPVEDIQQAYVDGLVSQPEKLIFDTILTNGPTDTVNLRRKIHMTSKASNSPFERALVKLQRDFKILPVGIARTGGWRYSFIYELVHRYYPQILPEARAITRSEARMYLSQLFFRSVGGSTVQDLQYLFQWSSKETKKIVEKLLAQDLIYGGYYTPGSDDEMMLTPELLS